MAVVRFKATRAYFRRVALDVQDHPRLAKELARAAQRPGLVAEITAAEARVLCERLPSDPRWLPIVEQVEAAERGERRRHTALQDHLARVRQKPPT